MTSKAGGELTAAVLGFKLASSKGDACFLDLVPRLRCTSPLLIFLLAIRPAVDRLRPATQSSVMALGLVMKPP